MKIYHVLFENMSFRLKLILSVTLIETLLVCSLISIGLNWLRSTNEIELTIRAHNVAEVLAATAKNAVLTYDIATLESIISEVTKNENIAFVDIYNTERELAYAGNLTRDAHQPNKKSDLDTWHDGYYEVHQNITKSGKIVGRVELGVSTSHIDKVMSQAYNVAVGVSIIGIAISALFSWLLGSYLTTRLRKLRSAAKVISDGELGYQVDIKGNDELGRAAQSFNSMSYRIKELYDELNESLTVTKEMSNVISESEIYTSTVLNSIADVIISTDKLGNIETVNTAILKTFGYTFAQLIGKNISILLPDTLNVELNFFNSRTVCPVPTKINFQAQHKDGTTFTVEITTSQIEIHNELIFVNLITDVTERNKTEQDMILARQDAEQASRSKSEFLANMSHEIRTPMNGVIGMLQVLDKTQLDSQQRKFVNTAVTSADLLLHIINDILDFSKIEAGKFNLDLIDFDLHTTIESTAELLSQTVRNQKIEISCYIEESVPEYVKGDPTRLTQILMNLGGNAIKFTDTGEVSINVSMKAFTNNQNYLHFEIKDTGIGIAKELQQQLFKPFQQADGSTSRRFGGTGLGLSICKYLVELMNGEIGLKSEPGEGSTFWFNIYLEQSENHHTSTVKLLTNKHILIVDDNETNLSVMHSYLNDMDVTIYEARNGDQAIEAVTQIYSKENGQLDAILMDMQMPNLDGIETAKLIHCNEQYSTIPIMLISSLGQIESIPVESGISLCLSKPIRHKHFIDFVYKLIQSKEKQHDEVTGKGNNSVTFNAKVMLVEDNIINQEVAFEMLKLLGISPVLAENGIEAVENFKLNKFDLILMDCQMPVMDGYNATKLIREYEQEEGLQETPIVALTANAMSSDKIQCVEAGMNDHIPKPITDECLVETLSKWLNPITINCEENMSVSNNENSEVNSDNKQHHYIDELQYENMYKKLGERYLSIIEKYKVNTLQIISNIRLAIESNDIESIKLYAHTLKGSSDSMAAIRICELASKIESNIKENGDCNSVSNTLEVLEQDYHETLKVYERLSGDQRKSA